MKMGVLGTLVLRQGQTSLVPSAPKVRQLLAYLMLNANRMVRASECIDELWDSPPKSAMSTLQTYILQIRRILRNLNEGKILVTRSPGYQLAVGDGQLDRFVFEEAVGQGRQAVADGRDESASALFCEALAVWRGPVLADVEVGSQSSPHVAELEETRRYALQQRIEADLRLGRHDELLEDLRTMASLYPTHENVHAQFMIALYRSGRPQRALAVFHGLERELADRLGIEPTPRLRRLRAAILAGDPALDLGPVTPSGPTPAG